jgi:hypothetical protein
MTMPDGEIERRRQEGKSVQGASGLSLLPAYGKLPSLALALRDGLLASFPTPNP